MIPRVLKIHYLKYILANSKQENGTTGSDRTTITNEKKNTVNTFQPFLKKSWFIFPTRGNLVCKFNHCCL